MRTGIDVRFMSVGDPLGPEIEEFLRRGFPHAVAKAESVMEAVVDAIVGSRQVRLGPAPGPESIVAIREVVRSYIREDRPIPIMIPAGPKKPTPDASVDMAELSALRILANLQDAVQQHYAPGLEMRLRLEDFTGFYLEGEGIRETVDRYIADFEALIAVLGYAGFITPIRERAMVNWEDFHAKVAEINALMLPYLSGTDGSEDTMAGWPLGAMMRVPVARAQRDFLLDRYAKIYPGLDKEAHMRAMASYLSCAVGRRHLGASGASESWNHGRIDIYFAPPVVGTPHELVSTRLYYRTVPLSHSKQHIPFWRARGILKVKGGDTRMSFAPWGAEAAEGVAEFTDGERSVAVRADYMVEG